MTVETGGATRDAPKSVLSEGTAVTRGFTTFFDLMSGEVREGAVVGVDDPEEWS